MRRLDSKVVASIEFLVAKELGSADVDIGALLTNESRETTETIEKIIKEKANLQANMTIKIVYMSIEIAYWQANAMTSDFKIWQMIDLDLNSHQNVLNNKRRPKTLKIRLSGICAFFPLLFDHFENVQVLMLICFALTDL